MVGPESRIVGAPPRGVDAVVTRPRRTLAEHALLRVRVPEHALYTDHGRIREDSGLSGNPLSSRISALCRKMRLLFDLRETASLEWGSRGREFKSLRPDCKPFPEPVRTVRYKRGHRVPCLGWARSSRESKEEDTRRRRTAREDELTKALVLGQEDARLAVCQLHEVGIGWAWSEWNPVGDAFVYIDANGSERSESGSMISRRGIAVVPASRRPLWTYFTRTSTLWSRVSGQA
jgi:hypothetical protein